MAEVTIRELRNHGGSVVERRARRARHGDTRRPAGRRTAPAPAGWKVSFPVDLVASATSPRRPRSATSRHRRRRRSGAVTAATTRGLLDTSTLILLGDIEDTTTLPDEPFISVVTLAELTVGPLVATSDEDRVSRQARSAVRRISIRSCSTPLRRADSARSRHRFAGLVARRPHAPTTR